MDEFYTDDDVFENLDEATLADLECYSDDEVFDDVDESEFLELERPAKRCKTEGQNPTLTPHVKTEDLDDDVSLPSLPFRNPGHLELAERLLKENFGYKSFRHEQAGAIQTILGGENALVIFPTGAGKSLCYQIPAIAFPELDRIENTRPPDLTGITLVVSPLLALMKDQVESMVRRGIAAESLDSSKPWAGQQSVYARLRKSQLDLLYVAPERLNNELFLENLKAVRGGIRLLAVDEAHCVSEWGHSFRPDYLKVARFVKEINAERVIALTATATPRVAIDIAEAFGIKESCIFKTSPYRPNLYLDAMTINTPAVDSVKDYMNMISGCEDPETERRFQELVCWLNTHPGPTLIYVAVREQAEAHAKYLVRKGFRAAPFHAKLKTEKKKEVQEGFMSGAIEVVCATIAFGMGIDKPDIRNVVHWDLSNSIEEYSQQIGRAGRDGQPSCCMFYLAPSAFHLRQLFARGDVASRHSIKLLVEDILRRTNGLPVGAIVNVSHFSQGKRFDIQQNTMAVIYATLELTFELLRATTPEYSNYRFTPEPSYATLFTGHCTPEVKAIKEYAVKDGNDLELDFKRAARLSGASTLEIMKTLDVWQDKGSIDILKYGIEQRYFIVKQLPQTQEEIDEVIDKVYANQLAKEQDSLTRNQQVMDLITGARCFAVALADHFGMGLPDKKDSCGHCIFCVKGRPIQMPRKPDVGPVKAATIRGVLRATPIRDDPRFLTRVGFGMSSPRIIREKLSKKAVFRSLASYDFDVSFLALSIVDFSLWDMC
ncbi:P-loop containing nucleoside triphosphate hydrolase protein [Rhypophila decipiens]|uniref:DNA 3'-5' helicase n=1 Tax=Rhypophila decipiens TaxID=261697 RepID=A0AAN6Y7Z0_9PEZI|nr:P-loop containing nucleoside triphosphate hydrolase protein [Rhypophila decipiens]